MTRVYTWRSLGGHKWGNLRWPSGILMRIYRGLTGDESVVTVPEAQWVTQRLAELLDWDFDPILLA